MTESNENREVFEDEDKLDAMLDLKTETPLISAKAIKKKIRKTIYWGACYWSSCVFCF